ncbi:MAG: T9SS type A sorting domain-containing protein [Saprospiraceae bacterium]|nr:T9SS type A sorting domain-containing protein [Saprospiraceae bacterium]
MAGIRPNSVIDEEGNIIYVSVEKDILHFYKYDANGNELAHLNSAQTTGAFSKLIKLASGDFAIAYDLTPLEVERTIKILTFNPDLEIIQNQEIDLPFTSEACILYSIFELNSEIFLSIFNWEEHFIFKILEDGSTEFIFSGAASFASEEKLTFLSDQSLLIEYQYGTEHLIRRISIRDKQLIWEKKYLNEGRIEMQYKTAHGNDQWIALASAERDWVDGEARDTVRLKKIDLEDGSIILDTFLIPDNHCITHLSDFKFNAITGRFYLSLAGCFPIYNLSLTELDVDFNFLRTAIHDVNSDELFMHDPAYLHVLPEGEMVFVFKSRKDSIERGNLYITILQENLSFGNVLEINLPPKNSSESISDILTYDNHKILFTGSIPSSELNVFWEEVQFFTMLIDFESTTSTENTKLNSRNLEIFPNPVHDMLYFKIEEDIKQVQIHHISGQLVFHSQNNQSNFISVDSLPGGVYTLTLTTNSGHIYSRKFLKNL